MPEDTSARSLRNTPDADPVSDFAPGLDRPVEADAPTLPLGRIGRLLDDPPGRAARARAIEDLLPHLWARAPWQRYRACCLLSTRVFLPYYVPASHLVEWSSFPNVFVRSLRGCGFATMPPTPEARRAAVARTLRIMLNEWLRLSGGLSLESGQAVHIIPEHPEESLPVVRLFRARPSTDIAIDICEAIGRLQIYEAVEELMTTLRLYRNVDGPVRMAALVALAALPPERLDIVWQILQKQSAPARRLLASSVHYMTDPAAVPFLIETLPYQTGMLREEIARPILMTLGNIGDLRALPTLQAIARDETDPLCHTARTAIKRLMKEASGHEEVTLLRASHIASTHPATLLRPASGEAVNVLPDELLRPAGVAPKEASALEASAPIIPPGNGSERP